LYEVSAIIPNVQVAVQYSKLDKNPNQENSFPIPDDRSAVKLARSDFAGKYAILIYGFEDRERPLGWLIERSRP
jgi:hypothetical protein